MSEALHVERQQVAAWVHVVVALCVGGSLVSMVAASPDGGRWWAVVPAALLVAIYGVFSPMTVRVESGEMTVDFGYFGRPRWRFPIAEIRDARVVEFSPLRQYGGWGIRAGRDSVCLNQRGNRGVRFGFLGRDYVIGSDDPARLLAALRTAGAGMAGDAPDQR